MVVPAWRCFMNLRSPMSLRLIAPWQAGAVADIHNINLSTTNVIMDQVCALKNGFANGLADPLARHLVDRVDVQITQGIQSGQ